MAERTERSLYSEINGLLERDDTLCTKAIADDEEVDQLRRKLIRLVLKFASIPAGRVLNCGEDFGMKLLPNTERVADEATNIA